MSLSHLDVRILLLEAKFGQLIFAIRLSQHRERDLARALTIAHERGLETSNI